MYHFQWRSMGFGSENWRANHHTVAVIKLPNSMLGIKIVQLSEMPIKEQCWLKYQYKIDFKVLISCNKFSSFLD